MSDTPSFLFSEQAAQRIVKSTRAAESAPKDLTDRETERQKGGVEIWTVKIASAAGYGKYWLTLLLPPGNDISPTATLTEADFGTAFTPSDPNTKFLGLNSPEIGQSTNALDVGSLHTAIVLRRQTNGTTVLRITGYGLADCDAGSSSGSSTP